MFNAYLITNAASYDTVSAIIRGIDWFIVLCLVVVIHQRWKLKKQNDALRQRIAELEGTQANLTNGDTT